METIEKTKKTNSFLELIVLEPDADTLNESLGMTEERFGELADYVKSTINDENKENSKISGDLHHLSLFAKHANELAIMCMIYGKAYGRQQVLVDIADVDPTILLKLGLMKKKSSEE